MTVTIDFASVLAVLAVVVSSTVGTFVVAVILDVVAGVVLAIRTKTFDWAKLPTFLETQFGTVRALALLGLVAGAVVTTVGSALLHGGLTRDALQAIADAALAAATTGSAGMLLSVVSDLFSKVSQLLGRDLPTPPGNQVTVNYNAAPAAADPQLTKTEELPTLPVSSPPA